MNFDEIQNFWGAAQNQPSPEQMKIMREQFAKRLRTKYRGFVALMIFASLGLIIPCYQLVRHILGGGYFHFGHEWGSLVLLSLPLLAVALFVRQYCVHRVAHARFELSIQASLRALLDENRLARTRSIVITTLNLVMLIMMPIVVNQLRATGKAGDEILVPAFVLLPAIMLVVLGAVRWNYVRKLKPRQRELEKLIGEYEVSQ